VPANHDANGNQRNCLDDGVRRDRANSVGLLETGRAYDIGFRVGGKAIARDQETRDRAADQSREYQAERGTGNRNLRRRCEPMTLCEHLGPGCTGAMTA
jgi:hypothetical protein